MKSTWTYAAERPIDVICMGRVAVDLYAEQIGISLEEVQSFKKYLGGCAGNIAVGTARLGLQSSMLSCVGADAMGQFLKNELQKEKVDVRALRETKDHLTGLVLLGIDPPHRFPLIFYRRDCADMQLQKEDIDTSLLSLSKSLLITGTGLSTDSMRAVSHHAVEQAKSLQTKVIFDLDYRPVLWGLTSQGDGESRYKSSDKVSQHYQAMLPHCDLLVGTEEETLIAGKADTLSIALQTIRSYSDAPIVVKKGERGCHVYLGDIHSPLVSPCFPVDILNVLGAGDAFMSGLLRGLLRGEDWEIAAKYANAAGAIVVTKHGCAPAMPSFDEMQQFIANYENHQGEKHVRISHS